MSTGLASDEVAEDYKNSLEDLTTNDRFQISNLTVIAKENTEHAMAISRVLENHIRTTPPSQKLPALYVVDSVVKNVGTPYTLFLGRNLYQTFMNAYTLVDAQTRRKLDEMLKTWKEPVPGSLDTRPVFPAEITRSIENALIKARTAALQQQQSKAQQEFASRARNPNAQWRKTPTPQPYPSHQYGRPSMHTPDPYKMQHATSSAVDIGSLHRDIEFLISKAQADLALSPLDSSLQQRLKALRDLQTILLQQQLPQDQLKLIRDQVTQLSATASVAARPPSVQPQNPAPAQPTAAAAAPAPVPNLQALLNPGTLADLLKVTAQRTNTPPPAVPAVPPVAPSVAPQAIPALSAENPLIASLRARGLLPQIPGSNTPTPTPQLPLIVPGHTPAPGAIPGSSFTTAAVDVSLTSTSIKTPRPYLIASLYEDKPNRCNTCGRRFTSNEDGKQKKARHLDWHFKTNQRMTEALQRGQSRSWFLDEMDWIKARDFDDDSGMADQALEALSGDPSKSSGEKARKRPYIRAPNDASLRNAPCPICQENFESTWSEEVQDWIWQDAVKIGNRVYHASCYEEVSKEGRPSQLARERRSETPESILGKRKAEASDRTPTSVKVKTEP